AVANRCRHTSRAGSSAACFRRIAGQAGHLRQDTPQTATSPAPWPDYAPMPRPAVLGRAAPPRYSARFGARQTVPPPDKSLFPSAIGKQGLPQSQGQSLAVDVRAFRGVTPAVDVVRITRVWAAAVHVQRVDHVLD